MVTVWHNIKRYVAGVVAFVACPCHLLITLPLLISLTAGTALGGWLANSFLLIASISTVIFVGGLALAIRWSGQNGACPVEPVGTLSVEREQLIAEMITSIGRRTAPDGVSGLDGLAFRRVLLQLLAEGQPVSLDALATAAGLARPEVEVALGQCNIEYDESGNIIGAGLTLWPTPHRITMDGRTLYTWCALDALMYLPLLERAAEVESPCAGTGVPVKMQVTPQRVEAVDPPEAVVSLLAPAPGLAIRPAFCNHVNFFSSAHTAAAWLAQHPDAVVLPVAEAYELGRHILTSYSKATRNDD